MTRYGLKAWVTLAVLALAAFSARGAEAAELWIIPEPKEMDLTEGTLTLVPDGRIFIPQPVERPEFLAAQRLRDAIEEASGITYQLDRLGRILEPQPGDIILTVSASPSDDPIQRESYEIRINGDTATIHGNAPEGLFYGIQTMIQIAEQAAPELPQLTINDSPDFIHRGLHHDVSRGKVPTLDTLKWIVDYMARYKANQFQLYVEHPFMFRFNPAIAHNPDGLTADEILELQEYCRDRRVLFVPSLQSFGHMAGALSLPEYRHLADLPLPGGWEELNWNQRMHGATINMSDPDALELLEKMHDDYVTLFDAPFVNVSADETYDLGRGQLSELAEELGVGHLYLQHINWLNELVKSYDKRMMFWGDIVKQHRDLWDEIPRDAILLDWGYSANVRFEETTALFAEAGLDYIVCPGTSGWRRVLNDVNNADLNIRGYIAAGHRNGAIGVLNTDWGDHGHYNPLAGSLHGFALGASMSWNVNTPDQEAFDHAWNYQVFGDREARVIQAIRDQVVPRGTWVSFYLPLAPEGETRSWYQLTEEMADQLIEEGAKGAELLAEYLDHGNVERWIVEELHHASRMNVLVGRKSHLERAIEENDGASNPELAEELRQFVRDTNALHAEFQQLWRNRNKESDLGDIDIAIDRLTSEALEIADAIGS